MRLITKIEINYLRSLHGATLSGTADTNIIFGRNDSGKSNLLRALNLFFNSETEPGRPLDFGLDITDQRKIEARQAKARQFIWIKVTIAVPSNFRTSLGREITIKRQWNRDGGVTETIWPSGLERNAQLTRFRNQIDFTYIPAVKGLDVYSDLIERMYAAMAETEVLQDATGTFVEAIQDRTTQLSERLSSLFGKPAKIAAPTEMSKLFRTLDFSHGDEGHSLLRQKGDGVKARHLPSFLRFINENENRKKFFIWGFEEPENSLDLMAAGEEAKRFLDYSLSTDTQIFVTSHSPAFYLAGEPNDSNVRRYFIRKQHFDPDKDSVQPPNAAFPIASFNVAEREMREAGLFQLPAVIEKLKETSEEHEQIAREAVYLRQQFDALNTPTLFVEGDHDVDLFSDVRDDVLQKSRARFRIERLKGTPSSTERFLSAIGATEHGLPKRAMFLFDNDRSGRSANKNLCGKAESELPTEISDGLYSWTLPKTESFENFAQQFSIPGERQFFTSEMLIEVDVALSVLKDIVKRYRGNKGSHIDDWKRTIHGDYFGNISQSKTIDLLNEPEWTSSWFYARGVPDLLKKSFNKSISKSGDGKDDLAQLLEVISDTILG